MNRIYYQSAIAALAWLAAGLLGSSCRAGSLPTFEDFRRVDRERRIEGQWQTAELLAVTRIDPALVARTAENNQRDPQVLWGAAELLTDWPKQRAMFESALAAGGTNVALACRLAGFAAQHRDLDLARPWLRYCETHDPGNTVSWLVEFWMRKQPGEPLDAVHPPATATGFSDYAAPAALARIALLEAAGYTKYSARRLGYGADRPVLSMARDLARPPLDQALGPFLATVAAAMQRRPTFVVTELVGQSVERAVLATRPNAVDDPAVSARLDAMIARRQDLQGQIARLGRNAVDAATESEMIGYFDEMLAVGEEAAMKHLAVAVRQPPTAP